MDPATLYILLTLTGGAEKALEKGFPDVGMCKSYVQDVIRPRTDLAKVARYECVSMLKQQSAPEWYVKHAPQKLIHGVPFIPSGDPYR